LEGWYRACVEVQANVPASPDEAALPEMVIPGGQFVRVRLRGSAPGVYNEIAPSYQHLMATAQRDESRPSLEHYRRLDEIDILMPIV
jgi:DNA gyrase inhibitor GyrI